jgi:hypothetical protein
LKACDLSAWRAASAEAEDAQAEDEAGDDAADEDGAAAAAAGFTGITSPAALDPSAGVAESGRDGNGEFPAERAAAARRASILSRIARSAAHR